MPISHGSSSRLWSQSEFGFYFGGLAGGQLTCATALGIASGNYPSIFGTGITIRGFIPFYPANQGVALVDNNVSNPEFDNPALLVTANSPPCLDYQGSQDGLVNPAISYALQSTYTSHGNSHCAVIELPFGGHGSDLDFSGIIIRSFYIIWNDFSTNIVKTLRNPEFFYFQTLIFD